MAQRPNSYPIDPTATSGTDLATIMNQDEVAEASNNSGNTRPAYLTAGGIWTQTVAGGTYNLMLYDGTKDVVIGDNQSSGLIANPPVGTDQSITAADPGDVPLTLKGDGGQTADLQQWVDSAGTTQASVGPTGDLTLGQGNEFIKKGRLVIGPTYDPTIDYGYINVQTKAGVSGGINIGYRSLAGSTNNRAHMQFENPAGIAGLIITRDGSTIYATSSDYRLKENVADMTDGLTKVDGLRPVSFSWKSDTTHATDYGFIAHEFGNAIPHGVIGAKDAVDSAGNIEAQMINRDAVIPFLVSAIKTLKARIEVLEAKVP